MPLTAHLPSLTKIAMAIAANNCDTKDIVRQSARYLQFLLGMYYISERALSRTFFPIYGTYTYQNFQEQTTVVRDKLAKTLTRNILP